MRSIPLLAATTVILLSVGACGDDGGGTGVSPNPTASFTLPTSCTAGTACLFTDTSSDPQGNTTITTRTWNWGDGSLPESNLPTPSHIYQAAGTYNVTLTVTDNTQNTGTSTQSLTVTAPTGGLSPIASFTIDGGACTGLSCSFTSTSTDDGDIVSETWDFGEPGSPTNTATGPTASHTYLAAGTYTVTLTVTDNEGLTGSTTQSVTVGTPTGQSCTAGPGSNEVTCTIALTQRSTVKIRLESEDCEIGNNNLFIPPPEPRAQTVFFNMCNLVPPQEVTLTDAGAPMVFEAGTQLPIVFRRGADPIAVAPQAQVAATAANTWTISIDDGGNPGGPGEPDFQDVVLTVMATPQ